MRQRHNNALVATSLALVVILWRQVSLAFSTASSSSVWSTPMGRSQSSAAGRSPRQNAHNHHRAVDASSSWHAFSANNAQLGDEINNNNNNNNINNPPTTTTPDSNNNNNMADDPSKPGRLEELKQMEAKLSRQLAAVRREKLSAIRSRPLTIGIIGFGRFGQFIARTFCHYAGRVVVTSRTDYSALAQTMGVQYISLDDPERFVAEHLDVIVFAVSIMSFEATVRTFAPVLERDLQQRRVAAGFLGVPVAGPLIVDVLSVKEHARQVMLDLLPKECDILCTHPMFGPDSGKNGWHRLNFVYEKTRIDGVLLDHTTTTTDPASSSSSSSSLQLLRGANDDTDVEHFVEEGGRHHSVHEDSEAHVEGMDRMERFLSIWEEEGCRMVPMSCSAHDTYAANSQFITHLVGRVLGSQGLAETPIDTSGFQSVLKLIGSTTADSFDLFYGLYKYNQNSLETIKQLQSAMNDVVAKLHEKEKEDAQAKLVERVAGAPNVRDATGAAIDAYFQNTNG